MKEEGDDRYKQIDERLANMEKKFSMIDGTSEIKAGQAKFMKTRIMAKP